MPIFSLIAADFDRDLIDAMIAVAEKTCRENSATIRRTLRVPGCYEIPLIADVELENADLDGLIVLGSIERGETLHGEVMGQVVCRALVELQLKHRKPIGIGIIGPGATAEQAKARHVNSAAAAVRAAVRVATILNDMAEKQ